MITEDIAPKTFDDIAEAQGWNSDTRLFLCRQFIAEARMYEDFDRFARRQADLENTEVPT